MSEIVARTGWPASPKTSHVQFRPVCDVWAVPGIKRELVGGAGALGDAWRELREKVDQIIEEEKKDKKSGRRRIQHDWLLLFTGYVLSKQPEMQEFWKNSSFNVSWAEAGFDISKKPCDRTLWNRFTELENPKIVAASAEVADRFIANAMHHDPEIGRVVHIYFSGWHSRADCRRGSTASTGR